MRNSIQNRITADVLLILLYGILNHQYLFAQSNIGYYLPGKNESGKWQPVGSADIAVGEDLFLLINGGAEIYHEYGFKQVIMQSYENDSGKSINLELYEMNDSGSAYGIYSFKTGSNGKDVHIGDESLLEDYYLNVWKGNFLITVTGFDSEQGTIDGLMAFANIVDKKIKKNGDKPEILNLLINEGLINHSVKYLKGNLALFNNYEFGLGDIFGLKKGVIGDYSTFKILIFKYIDSLASEKWFRSATKKMISNSQYKCLDNPEYPDHLVFDRDDERIFMSTFQNYILIVGGTLSTNGNAILGELRLKIKNTG